MINNYYSNKEVINEISKVILKEGKVELQKLLEEWYYKQLLEDIKILKLKKKYIPQFYRYEYSTFKDKKLILLMEYFLFKIFKKDIKFYEARLLLFKHKDYVLLNDQINERNGIKLILDLTKGWNEESGGYTLFVKDNKEMLKIKPNNNTLTIIITDNKMKSFVKYINHKAQDKKRIFIELNYKFI